MLAAGEMLHLEKPKSLWVRRSKAFDVTLAGERKM
jgi:hypothetical protein